MQSRSIELENTEMPKYYLFKHPLFAFTGMLLLALILLFCWLLFFPKLIEPVISLPFNPWFFVAIFLLGCVFIVWFIVLLVLSLTSLRQHRAKGRKTGELQRMSTLRIIIDLAVFLLLVFGEQIYLKMVDIFPQYRSLWQFIYYGLGLGLITAVLGYFILKMTPWHLRKELGDKEII